MGEFNLDNHIKRLLLIAIRKYRTQEEQAKSLGITSRTFINYCIKYKIHYKLEKFLKHKINETKSNAIT